MKVKVFHLRLTKEHLETDQEKLNQFLDNVAVKKTSAELVSGQINFWSILVFYEVKTLERETTSTDKINYPAETELTDEEKKILDALKHWRLYKAKELNLPSFMICSNAELTTISKTKPETINELIKIRGFGGQKIAKFGSDIIALLNSI